MSWIAHVKSVAEEKGISFKDALKIARDTYKPTKNKPDDNAGKSNDQAGKTKKKHHKGKRNKTHKKDKNNAVEKDNVSINDILERLESLQKKYDSQIKELNDNYMELKKKMKN